MPKVQLQVVGVPVERSWKLTINGEQPDKGEAVKFETGACPYTVKLNVIASKEIAISFERWMYSFGINGTRFKVLLLKRNL